MSSSEKAQITVHVDRSRDIIKIKGDDFWALHGTTLPFVTSGRLQGLSTIDRINVSIDGTMHFECQPKAGLQDALAQALAYATRIHGLSLNNDDITVNMNVDEPIASAALKQARQLDAKLHGRHSRES